MNCGRLINEGHINRWLLMDREELLKRISINPRTRRPWPFGTFLRFSDCREFRRPNRTFGVIPRMDARSRSPAEALMKVSR
jgi:hypothetical protein